MSELSLDDAIEIAEFLKKYANKKDFAFRLGGILAAMEITDGHLLLNDLITGASDFRKHCTHFMKGTQSTN